MWVWEIFTWFYTGENIFWIHCTNVCHMLNIFLYSFCWLIFSKFFFFFLPVSNEISNHLSLWIIPYPFGSVTLFVGSSNVCTSTESSYVSWSSGDSPSMSMDSPYHTANQNAAPLTNNNHSAESGNKVCLIGFHSFWN